MKKHSKWRGLKALVHDGVDATLELVREGNESTARIVTMVTDEVDGIRKPVRFVDSVRRISTDAVLGTIRFTNRTVETVSDLALDQLDSDEPTDRPIPLDSEVVGSKDWWADTSIAIVNAAVGDHLARRENVLDLDMTLRGDVPPDTTHVAVFVHGLGATEWSWFLNAKAYHGHSATSFGTLLWQDFGIVPIYVRYNSGRRVDTNGEHLSEMLTAFLEAHPSIQTVSLFGHSMGGLVVRQACAQNAPWTESVDLVVYLGTPHQGAPLAKLGAVVGEAFRQVPLPAYKIIGRIVDTRSEGIQDLADGIRSDELPLPDATHVLVGGTVTRDADHPMGQIIGDTLVRLGSATTWREGHFEIRTFHHGKMMHHEIQNHPDVYATLAPFFTGTESGDSAE